MTTFPFSLDNIFHVPEKLFDKILYYRSGQIDSKYLSLLKDGGAKEETYDLSSDVTHFFVGQDADIIDVEDAKLLYKTPIVRPEWIVYCVKVGRLISLDGFSGEKNQLFSSVVATASDITGEDLKSLWASISFYGGRLTLELSKESTHLICNNSNSPEYTTAKQKNISVVCLHWVTESIKKNKLVYERLYDPSLYLNVPPQLPLLSITYPDLQAADIQQPSQQEEQHQNQTANTTQIIPTVMISQQDEVTIGSVMSENQMQPGGTASQGLITQQQQMNPFLQSPNVNQVGNMNMMNQQQGMVSTSSDFMQNQMMQTAVIAQEQQPSQILGQQQMNQQQLGQQMGQQNPQQLGQMSQQNQQQQMTQLSQSFMPQQQNQMTNTVQIIPHVMVNQQGMVSVNSVNQMMPGSMIPQQQSISQQMSQSQPFSSWSQVGNVNMMNRQEGTVSMSPGVNQNEIIPTTVIVFQQQPSQILGLQTSQQIQQQLGQQMTQMPQHQMSQQNPFMMQPSRQLGQQMGQHRIRFHSAGRRFGSPQQQRAEIINQTQMSPQIKAEWPNMNPQHREKTLKHEMMLRRQEIQQQTGQLQQIPSGPQMVVTQQQSVANGQQIFIPQVGQQLNVQAHHVLVGQGSTFQQQPQLLQIQQQQSSSQTTQPSPQKVFIVLQQQQPMIQASQFLMSQQPSHSINTNQLGNANPQNMYLNNQQRMNSVMTQNPNFPKSHYYQQQLIRGIMSQQSPQPQRGVIVRQSLQQKQPQVGIRRGNHSGSQIQQQVVQFHRRGGLPQQHQNISLQQPIQVKETITANLLSNRLQGNVGHTGPSSPVTGSSSPVIATEVSTPQAAPQLMCPPPPPVKSQPSSNEGLSPQHTQNILVQRKTLTTTKNSTKSVPLLTTGSRIPTDASQTSPNNVPNLPSPRAQLYGYGPNIKLPSDGFLLGCVFWAPTQLRVKDWHLIVERYGGEVEQDYCPRVTHILCDNQKFPDIQQVLTDSKRLVTLYWLSDVCLKKCVVPPYHAVHIPVPFTDNPPLKNKIVSISGFSNDDDRSRVKVMLQMLGAQFSSPFTKYIDVLVTYKPEGEKYTKAREWSTPVVNVQFLNELMFGHSVYESRRSPKYQQFTPEQAFIFDSSSIPILMAPWKMPIRVNNECFEMYKNRKRSSQVKTEHLMDNDEPKKAKITGDLVDMESLSPPEMTNMDSQKMNIDVVKQEPEYGDISKEESTLTRKPTVIAMISSYAPIYKDKMKDKILKLGGRVTEDSHEATHLIIKKTFRTIKLFIGLSQVKYIVDHEWLVKSLDNRSFLDATPFILSNEFIEKAYGVKIFDVLAKPNRNLLFAGVTFFITPNCLPSVPELQEIVEAAGGQVDSVRRSIQDLRKTSGKYVIITCVKDFHMIADTCKYKNIQGLYIHTPEFIFESIMKQKLKSMTAVSKLYRDETASRNHH